MSLDFAVAANGRIDGPQRGMAEGGSMTAKGRSPQAGLFAHPKFCGTAFDKAGSLVPSLHSARRSAKSASSPLS